MGTDLGREIREIIQDIRSPLYVNAILLMINTILIAGAGFLFWFLVGRLYPEEEVGQALVLVGVSTFLAILSQLGFGAGIIRFLPSAKGGRTRLVNSCLTISTMVSLGLATVVLATMGWWFPQGRGLFSMWALAPIFLLLVPMQVNAPIVDNSFIAGRRALYVLIRNGIFQAARVSMPIILIGVLGVLGVLASYVFAHAIALFLAFFLLLPRLYPEFRPGPAIDTVVVNDIIHFSLGNHIADVLGALPYPVILIIVSHITGSADQAAFFGIPWLIASLLFAVPLMASVSLYAEGSHFEDRLWRDLRRTLRFIAPLLILGIIFIWTLGDWVLALIRPSYAGQGFELLKVLSLSSVFVAINALFVTVARVKKWVKAIIAVMAYIALGTILLAYFMIPIFGLVGAGYAWMAAQGTAAIVLVSLYIARTRSGRRSVAAAA